MRFITPPTRRDMPKPQLLKIAALAVLIFAVAVTYSLTITRYTLEGCVTFAARWGPLSVGSPYYVSLYVNSLIPYSRMYCTSPAFAASGELLYVIQITSDSGYEQTVAECLGEGGSIGLYPNPYYSGYLTVYVKNSCIVQPSYYTRFTLSLYYD
jgi:hypothetical protein